MTLSPRGADEVPVEQCPRARAALARLAGGVAPSASIDGAPAAHDAAIRAAAERIGRSHQPLFAGLGTDIAGARALYRLAARTGAICDHADGAQLVHGLRALQDRGQYTATLAELRSRADLIVCVGTPAAARFPRFFRRAGIGQAGSPCRRLVFVGCAAPAVDADGVEVDALPGSGDVFADLQQLAALVAQQWLREADPALRSLAGQLHAARYAVLVWEAGTLPRAGALVVEALNRIVGTLNRSTRAATFALGGSDGGHSVTQTLTWLGGLPIRTRITPRGLQHEPHRYDTHRLLAQRAVDALLWISSFDPERLPPPAVLPRVVLGPPAMARHLQAQQTVFIPVATPGLNADAHLFRTDGPVVLPLPAARNDGLAGVAEVLDAITQRLAREP